jgi:hypothetical protein
MIGLPIFASRFSPQRTAGACTIQTFHLEYLLQFGPCSMAQCMRPWISSLIDQEAGLYISFHSIRCDLAVWICKRWTACPAQLQQNSTRSRSTNNFALTGQQHAYAGVARLTNFAEARQSFNLHCRVKRRLRHAAARMLCSLLCVRPGSHHYDEASTAENSRTTRTLLSAIKFVDLLILNPSNWRC